MTQTTDRNGARDIAQEVGARLWSVVNETLEEVYSAGRSSLPPHELDCLRAGFGPDQLPTVRRALALEGRRRLERAKDSLAPRICDVLADMFADLFGRGPATNECAESAAPQTPEDRRED